MFRICFYVIVVLLALTSVMQSKAQEPSKLCFAEHCFRPTLDDFLESLSEEIDFSLTGINASRFLEIKNPSYVNGKAFAVKYAELTIFDKNHHILEYKYKFTTRNETTCENRYEALLETVHETHGPLRATDKPKPKKGFVSEVVNFDQGHSSMRFYETNGEYVHMNSVTDITSEISLGVSMSERIKEPKRSVLDFYPSCQLSVVMRRETD